MSVMVIFLPVMWMACEINSPLYVIGVFLALSWTKRGYLKCLCITRSQTQYFMWIRISQFHSFTLIPLSVLSLQLIILLHISLRKSPGIWEWTPLPLRPTFYDTIKLNQTQVHFNILLYNPSPVSWSLHVFLYSLCILLTLSIQPSLP